MDELVQSMRQRSSDIEFMQKANPHNVPELLLKEKDRSQKQNWVLKILKSIKILTPQLKSDIFYKSQEMMSIYEKIPLTHKQNLNDHFTQKVINLYIDFFNLISDKLPSNNSIKAFMRPNNAYIITDLIKCLIDLQRKKFRDLCIISSNLEGELKINRRKIVNDLLIDHELTFAQQKELEFLQKTRDLKQNKLHNPQELIRKILKQKFTNFIKMLDLKELESRININFLELKEKNQKNGYFIEKFRQKCLGKNLNKCNNYDLAGLYTKEQLRKIQEKLNARILLQKPLDDLELRQTHCSTQHEEKLQITQSLRQKAINELQKVQNLNIYQKASARKLSSIQKWLPLSIGKRLSKQNPWQIYIMNNRQKVKSSQIIEDPQISSMGVKEFLLMRLQQNFKLSEVVLQREEAENRFFDKRAFIDFGRRKEFELVEGDKIVLRKELFLPVLKQFQQKQQFSQRNHNRENQAQLRRKSTSEPKFVPCFLKLNTHQKTILSQQQVNSSSIEKQNIIPQPHNQPIAKSQQLKTLNLKKSPLALKRRKNSMEDILSERILQRKLQIEEQNNRYQNRMKLLFGTQNQKNFIRVKNKKLKTSIMGISIPFGNQHFLQ